MRILITGAAGLIGGELTSRLAQRGHAVTALVHRRHDVFNNAGALVASRRQGNPAAGEVVTMAADVREPGLGLAGVPAIDLVIHAAAITAFDASPTIYTAVNIDGTANAIALAESTGAALLHVSTAYVSGLRDGAILECETGREFVNGYEASKAAGEALVRAAMERGLRATIARPSIVVGDWEGGVIRDFDNIYMIFKLIAEGRVRVLPAAPCASLDLVPIDYVCSALVALAENIDSVKGRVFHLVGSAPLAVATIGEAIAAVPGLGVPCFVAPEAFAPEALPPVERRYHAAAASLYTSYLLRSPRFETANARALLPPCPPTDRAWLGRLLAHCIAAGFVKPVRGRQSTGAPATTGTSSDVRV